MSVAQRIYRWRIRLRTLVWQVMLRLGFMPLSLYMECLDELTRVKTERDALKAERVESDAWIMIAGIRKAVLLNHKLYTKAVQDLEAQHGIVQEGATVRVH